MSALSQSRRSREDEHPRPEIEAAWHELAGAVRRARVRLPGQLNGLAIPRYQLIEPLVAERACRSADWRTPRGWRTRKPHGRGWSACESSFAITVHRIAGWDVGLTEEGERLAAEQRRAVDRMRRAAFARQTPDEQGAAPALMQKIADAMGQQ